MRLFERLAAARAVYFSAGVLLLLFELAALRLGTDSAASSSPVTHAVRSSLAVIFLAAGARVMRRPRFWTIAAALPGTILFILLPIASALAESLQWPDSGGSAVAWLAWLLKQAVAHASGWVWISIGLALWLAVPRGEAARLLRENGDAWRTLLDARRARLFRSAASPTAARSGPAARLSSGP